MDRPPESLGYHLLLGDQREPVLDHGVQHHVKYGGGEWNPLGDPSVAFGQGVVIASHYGHHGEVFPIVTEVTLHPRHHPIFDKDIQATIPIKGVLGLP